MTQQRTILTSEEFFREYAHRDGDFELVKGEVIEMSPPGVGHGYIAVNVSREMSFFVLQHDLGVVLVESGFRIERGPDTVRGPDVSFIVKERLAGGRLPIGYFDGAPDLAVEVVSPSDTAASIEAKVNEYLANGTRRVWVIYPDTRTVVVHSPNNVSTRYCEGDVLTDEELLPGFSLPLSVIFA